MRAEWLVVVAVSVASAFCFGALAVEAETGQSAVQKPPAASSEELEPLEIEFPEPVKAEAFVRSYDLSSPHVEKPSHKVRPPFLVPKGTLRLSRGKPVTANGTPVLGKLEQITDGEKNLRDGTVVQLGVGPRWVQVDLGSPSRLYAVLVWRIYMFGSLYRDVVVQVSDDAEFESGVVTLFNNDWDNSLGLGKGTNKEYEESWQGRLIDAKGTQGRYVRVYSNGGVSSRGMRYPQACNQYIEVEVFGRAVEAGL